MALAADGAWQAQPIIQDGMTYLGTVGMSTPQMAPYPTYATYNMAPRTADTYNAAPRTSDIFAEPIGNKKMVSERVITRDELAETGNLVAGNSQQGPDIIETSPLMADVPPQGTRPSGASVNTMAGPIAPIATIGALGNTVAAPVALGQPVQLGGSVQMSAAAPVAYGLGGSVQLSAAPAGYAYGAPAAPLVTEFAVQRPQVPAGPQVYMPQVLGGSVQFSAAPMGGSFTAAPPVAAFSAPMGGSLQMSAAPMQMNAAPIMGSSFMAAPSVVNLGAAPMAMGGSVQLSAGPPVGGGFVVPMGGSVQFSAAPMGGSFTAAPPAGFAPAGGSVQFSAAPMGGSFTAAPPVGAAAPQQLVRAVSQAAQPVMQQPMVMPQPIMQQPLMQQPMVMQQQLGGSIRMNAAPAGPQVCVPCPPMGMGGQPGQVFGGSISMPVAAPQGVTIGKCGNPSCNNPGTNMCSACQSKAYCSAECQRIDWPSHKPDCKRIRAEREKGGAPAPAPQGPPQGAPDPRGQMPMPQQMQSQVQIPVQQQLQPQVQIPVQQQVQMIPAQRAPMAPMAPMTFQAPLGGSFTAAPMAPMMPQMAGLPSGVSFVAQNIDSRMFGAPVPGRTPLQASAGAQPRPPAPAPTGEDSERT